MSDDDASPSLEVRQTEDAKEDGPADDGRSGPDIKDSLAPGPLRGLLAGIGNKPIMHQLGM